MIVGCIILVGDKKIFFIFYKMEIINFFVSCFLIVILVFVS